MDYTSSSPLTRYLTIKKITEFAEFAHDYVKQKCNNRFKYIHCLTKNKLTFQKQESE